MTITIRDYTPQDSVEVGRLIADTYREFNLSFASVEDQELMLGPFRNAWSLDEEHQRAVEEILRSPIMYVAENERGIIGVLRGRDRRLASLFVHKAYHRQGIARMLVERFEDEMRKRGIPTIGLAATLYAVPFYQRFGYKKSTGVRTGWSFEKYGFQYQPMRKVL